MIIKHPNQLEKGDRLVVKTEGWFKNQTYICTFLYNFRIMDKYIKIYCKYKSISRVAFCYDIQGKYWDGCKVYRR